MSKNFFYKQRNTSDGKLTIENVEIFDITGKVVMIYSSVMNNTVDISGISNGMYFVAVYSEGRKIVRKFIKE